MKQIALFPNNTKSAAKEITTQIIDHLNKNNVAVCLPDDCPFSPESPRLSTIPMGSIDYAICLGGDGTILQVVHCYPELKAPLLAINLGSLGFMASIPVEATVESLNHLLKGEFVLEKRMMMQGKNSYSLNNSALNEITIHRGVNSCLIDLAVYVDDLYLNTFCADGIIIATPSGSTAYSLAAGGPIVAPNVEAFVITPICPHTLSNRPIVLIPKEKIEIRYLSDRDQVLVDFDGFREEELAKGEHITITKSSRTVALVTLPDHDYFSTLRTKLSWSGKTSLRH